MIVAAAQMALAWHDREANYRKAREMAMQAREEGASLFVLPEMFATGFSLDAAFTGEASDGPTAAFLKSLAREFRMAVVGGFSLARAPEKPRNVALAVDAQGNEIGCYAKIHQIALLEEDRHYAPGDTPVSVKIEGMGVSLTVCYDLRFPELFRTLADDSDLILVIASWPTARQRHWDVLLQARAIETQCYMLGVNRVGEGGGYTFSGGSAVWDPAGEPLTRSGDEEALLVADIDGERVAEVRSSMPFLKERNPVLFRLAARRLEGE